MKSITRAMLAAGLLLGCSPAVAAEHLDCALALRNAGLDKAVFDQYRAGKNIGEALMNERGEDFRACAATNKWPSTATESAARVIFGGILTAGIAGEMRQLDLPVDRLTAALGGFVAGLDDDKRQKLADGELTDLTINPLFAMLTDHAILTQGQLTEAIGRKIGEYLSAYANLAFYRERFKTQ